MTNIPTPYFLIDENKLAIGLDKLKKALQTHWENYIIGYSYKTNSLLWVIDYFRLHGCYAEVVSDDEYELAKYCGVSEDHIIYNGIIKSKKSFIETIKSGGIVNIDAEYEIGWLEDLDPGDYHIGIRVNFDFESRCPGHGQCGVEGERFGFCYENGELKRAIDRIKQTGHKLTGIHLHKSSKTRELDVYKAIAEAAVEIVEKYSLELDFVDIGGGFFGELEGKPSFNDYFEMVGDILHRQFSPKKTTLIVEPGMALIGSPISYVTTVKDIKKTGSHRFIVTDGSRTHVDPLMSKINYFYRIEQNKPTAIIDRQVICGFTCMEHDRLFEVRNEQEISVGDHIIYEKVGAYTMCLSSQFIKFYPDVYVNVGEKIYKARAGWNTAMYTQGTVKSTGYEKNVLILSCGTRNKLIQYFRKTLNGRGKIIAADCSELAPALYEADKWYISKRLGEEGYLEQILQICRDEQISGVLSLIDTELSELARHTDDFKAVGTTVIGSAYELCEMSLDKYRMYQWLADHGYHCAKTWIDKSEFFKAVKDGIVNYPVFVKQRDGSASICITQATDQGTVDLLMNQKDNLLIQEFLHGQEIGADVYIDLISKEVVSIFTKKKIKMRAGETDKAVSFKNEEIFELIEKFAREAGYRGSIDIDIFDVDGEYYISEVNPRFGGGYPHAYECGCDHMKLIMENLEGRENRKDIGTYKEGVYMMKFNEIKML